MMKTYEYHSELAMPIQNYINEKRALGKKYDKESKIFAEFDSFIIRQGLKSAELSKTIAEKWIERRPNEKRKNQRYRLNFTKRFALYLQRKGYCAHYPMIKISTRDDSDFVPYIFTNEELGRLLSHFDNMAPSRQYPNGHLAIPLLFRTLICCGLRVSEAAKLQLKDVDLVKGVLLIREAKNDKKRYVPLSNNLWSDFCSYYYKLHNNSESEDYFFPNARGNPHATNSIYERFREALWHCGIEHKGRGYGPRVHDLRHTTASLLLGMGFSLKEIQEWLGHNDIGTTANIYGHLEYQSKINMGDKMGNTFKIQQSN